MYINCPYCGDRDQREFYVRGHDTGTPRPEGEVWSEDWNAFIHLRDNPAGRAAEFWHHVSGCGAWLIVDRDLTTHEVFATRAASDRGVKV